ncbi:hypothetical protein KFL_000550220 [Klebsormidium nitens]|uniref:Uncharacterized protein n=1 Tax=Klebsormidium nitens TaxID=105231 RepID=A0A1Y1HU17_KLENI|nr:hypothetical protein KFL_000550220 [Klebsormidium nitens]|eukprot:GAQ80491.1 hypothetical protein KFL_000550220 [Klebsormidium nitens]
MLDTNAVLRFVFATVEIEPKADSQKPPESLSNQMSKETRLFLEQLTNVYVSLPVVFEVDFLSLRSNRSNGQGEEGSGGGCYARFPGEDGERGHL